MRFSLLVFMLLVMTMHVAAAQEETIDCNQMYVISPDEAGLDQVWRVDLETQAGEQLTDLQEPVESYAFTPDGETLVIGTADHLWIQHGDEAPEILTTIPKPIKPVYYDTEPTISADGSVIVYTDWQGIWRIPAEGGEPEMIANSVFLPMEASAEDMEAIDGDVNNLAMYYAPHFLPGDQSIFVTVGRWEGRTFAVVDLDSGEVHEPSNPNLYYDFQMGHSLVMFNSSRVGGEFLGLARAATDQFENAELIFEDLSSFSDDDTLMLNEAVEYLPDQFYLLWSGLGNSAGYTLVDYNHETGESEILFSEAPDNFGFTEQFSPDGHYLVTLQDAEWSTETRGITGKLAIYDTTSGDVFELEDMALARSVQFNCSQS